jgi:hypothetical protein
VVVEVMGRRIRGRRRRMVALRVEPLRNYRLIIPDGIAVERPDLMSLSESVISEGSFFRCLRE